MEEGIIDPNETQKTKNTPLHEAAYYGQISNVDLLIQLNNQYYLF